MSPDALPRLDRRDAIKWMLAAAGTAMLFDPGAAGVDTPPDMGTDAVGYGRDPNLLKDYKPGDLWPLSFTPGQRRSASALCDIIIPADSESPGASAVGVPDFIDEWISAPYPRNQADRRVILDGLAWLDAECQKRFGIDFAGSIYGQQSAICDDICHEPAAAPPFKAGARFFKRFRNLTAGGFYTTKEGMRDLKYVGNVPQATFDGPPPEVLRQIGLT
jgi:hypothetical protein